MSDYRNGSLPRYQTLAQSFRLRIRDVPDFPEKGINFKDITPVLKDRDLYRNLVGWCARTASKYLRIDAVAALESRGFWFGPIVAYELCVPFVPIRKEGKLPYDTIRAESTKEYGGDVLEIHRDAVERGQRIVLIDDVLATGGTASAAAGLLREAGSEVVATIFPIELEFLRGRERLNGYPVESLVVFE